MKNSPPIILTVCLFAGMRTASAQNPAPWDGFYFGVNAGAASPHSCDTWSAAGGGAKATIAGFTGQTCTNGANPVAGVQFGENFQLQRLVLGLGADIDLWDSQNESNAVKYAGAMPPAGTYTGSGRLAPRAFGIVGPRIGYAGDTWLPYLRAGAIVAGGSRTSALRYTAPSAASYTASFSSGKNFSSTGWVAGGGTEIGLNGAGSITLEFLRAKFSSEPDFAASCAGTVTACAAFSGDAIETVHQRLTANIFRAGFTYYVSYWNL